MVEILNVINSVSNSVRCNMLMEICTKVLHNLQVSHHKFICVFGWNGNSWTRFRSEFLRIQRNLLHMHNTSLSWIKIWICEEFSAFLLPISATQSLLFPKSFLDFLFFPAVFSPHYPHLINLRSDISEEEMIDSNPIILAIYSSISKFWDDENVVSFSHKLPHLSTGVMQALANASYYIQI